jgi:hypothetical protein
MDVENVKDKSGRTKRGKYYEKCSSTNSCEELNIKTKEEGMILTYVMNREVLSYCSIKWQIAFLLSTK